MAASAGQRRHPLRDVATEAKIVNELGTQTARALFLSIDFEMDQRSQLTLVCLAHCVDLMVLNGNVDPVIFPADVADVMGIEAPTVSRYLRELTKAGLVRGNHRAGYKLSGPMLRDAEA